MSDSKMGQSTMTEHPHIALAPDVLAGKPVIRGTRLPVEFVIGLMATDGAKAISSGITRVSLTTTSSRASHTRAIR